LIKISYLSFHIKGLEEKNKLSPKICRRKEVIKIEQNQQLRESIDKWDLTKLKSFCTKKKWSLN
jgi:hypothetical protein